jgi:CHAD domain-containing protein
MKTSTILEKHMSLAYWMPQVLHHSAQAQQSFSSDPVHDLRTALRRCRSIAEGIRLFDRDPAWKKMRRAGKQLFNSLGDLRDTHVMMEWVEKLAPEGDPTRNKLTEFLVDQEQALKKAAGASLEEFDRRQWREWAIKLPDRAARVPLDGQVVRHLALERWLEAHALHVRALRNRTNIAFHQLRIALKRFRYTLESFLPRLDEAWGDDLKQMQDLLGDVHDLAVLWQAALRVDAFPHAEVRSQWRARIDQERRQRLNAYRERMVGSSSLWSRWRKELPKWVECRSLGLERMKIWASFLEPQNTHSKHVARIALELYDGLPSKGILRSSQQEAYRWVLHAAALMHDVGRSKSNQGHHKISARLIRKLEPPLGWGASELRIAALVARYHRGALPRGTQKIFGALSPSQRRLVQFLGGILRLACACDGQHDGKISRVHVESLSPVVTVRAEGYVETTSLAEHLAAARHLLELTYQRPVFVLASEQTLNTQVA